VADTPEADPPNVRKWLGWLKVAAVAIGIASPIVGSLWNAVINARKEAAARAQSAKDLAEAGQQDARKRVAELQERVLRLELAAQELQRKTAEASRRPHGRRRPMAPGVPVVVTYSARPMAATLDEAQKANPKPVDPTPPKAVQRD